MLHEIGHNLNLDHANSEKGKEYGDLSGAMGHLYASETHPMMCFNAANTFDDLEWYIDRQKIIYKSSYFWEGDLVGVAEYDLCRTGKYVAIKIPKGTYSSRGRYDYYISFNRKILFNSGTMEGGDQVLVHKRYTKSPSKSYLMKKLRSGESYSFQSMTVHVQSISTNTSPGIATVRVTKETPAPVKPVTKHPTSNPTPVPTPGLTPGSTPDPTLNRTLGPTLVPTLGLTLETMLEPTLRPTLGPMERLVEHPMKKPLECSPQQLLKPSVTLQGPLSGKIKHSKSSKAKRPLQHPAYPWNKHSKTSKTKSSLNHPVNFGLENPVWHPVKCNDMLERSCINNPLFFLKVKGRRRNCAWLGRKKWRANRYCKKSNKSRKMVCRECCNSCRICTECSKICSNIKY
uniref:Peptidase M11 gametolysin domain-containing protein n=1 Tax=Corethron hystrix TaxID=216773 RepID=A0A7S1BPC1_9STRA|mmetsp:Transcript_34401/g.79525  ORF Transcript_34401/g.79525 Transcript_34401/m.79525 type:complete len:401 (+) Transcript_34401:48-1250(+)